MPPRASTAASDCAAATAGVTALLPQQLQQVVMAMSAQNKHTAGGQFSDTETAELLCMISLRKQVGTDGCKVV